jgi:RNA polymerase sigma factor (sigma-70 family)
MTELAPSFALEPARPADAFSPTSWTGLPELRSDLERFLARRCRDPHHLDDVVQESLLRAARYRRTLRSADHLRPWILRIARNVLSDALRSETSQQRARDADFELLDLCCPQPPPEEQVEEPEEFFCFGRFEPKRRVVWALRLALARLDAAERSLLVDYYAGGGRRKGLARRFALPPALVKVRLFRARQRLRQGLERELRNLAAVVQGTVPPQEVQA